MKGLWWIRDDQRLNNNPTWEAAKAWQSETGGALSAVWVPSSTTPANLNEYPDALPRTSEARSAYESACFEGLRKALAQHGVEAVRASEDLVSTVKATQPSVIFFTHGAAHEEQEDEAAVKSTGIRCQGYHSRTLLTPKQALDLGLPPTYTPFRKRVEALLGDHPFADIKRFEGPQAPTWPFTSLEEEARAHLYAYISEDGAGRHYKTRRNGMLQPLDSTKLSAYLSRGLLHPKEVWNRCLEVEEAVGGCEEIYWIRFELLWREYFQWVAYEAKGQLFRSHGLKQTDPRPTPKGSRKAFELWTEGRTGDRLVDAAMRELKATGYQSNRARQNAASYWIHDLKQPWRVGAAYFEAMLLDYDAASNWGNWAYIAGVGNDPRPFRKFNTHKQAEQYDADGSYRDAWRT